MKPGAFSDPALARKLVGAIGEATEALGGAAVMEVCGTHTMAIYRAGLAAMLPPALRLISGPGCPVCVTTNAEIDRAVALARRPEVLVATFGDMVRVPGSDGSLEAARAEGGSVAVVYSPADTIDLARANPDKTVVFVAVGFETTAPGVAATVLSAREAGVANLRFLVMHKTVPPALLALLDGGAAVDGFILPAHVSTVIGLEPYRPIPERYGVAAAVAGFEPLDILAGILSILRQKLAGKPTVDNTYRRVARDCGNPLARAVMEEVFSACDARWRGLGTIRGSGLELRDEFAPFDARAIEVVLPPERESPGCMCGDVVAGRVNPAACPLFASECTPGSPVGPCMVSSEGTCAAWYKYNR